MDENFRCICGLTGNKVFNSFGAFCSQECYQVAVYMDRTKAKEAYWLQHQCTKIPGLRQTLEDLKWEHKMGLLQHSN